MADTRIAAVQAWEALDSRGTPTVACEVVLRGGARGSATAPSGASTGRHEAHEMRDGDSRYGGRGVRRAVRNVNGALADAITGLDSANQRRVDAALRAADGSADLHRFGTNAVLSISVATAIAHAAAAGQPLYTTVALGDEPLLPMPMVNVLSGGAHASGALDIQDVLVVPVGATSFAEALEWAWRVRAGTAAVARDRGQPTSLVADEGGLGLGLPSNRAALELIVAGMRRAGLEPGLDVAIAVDVAASQFHDNGWYRLRAENRTLTANDLVQELAEWCHDFPIVSLEDVLGEDDWPGWQRATTVLDGVQLLGDDLFVTNLDRLHRGIAEHVANAILVKPNQIGTLTDAHDVVHAARRAGYRTVLSARSGDTEDSWLADLAVGWRTGQIKVGSTTRAERTAKWNRLLRIQTDLRVGRFAGWSR